MTEITAEIKVFENPEFGVIRTTEKDWLAEYRAMTKKQEQEEQHDNDGNYQSAELAD